MANGTWKIARGKGSGQLPLIFAALIAVTLVLLGKAHSPIFDRIHVFYSDSVAPTLNRMSAPVVSAGKWITGIGEIFNVYSNNRRLREENARLQQWQNRAVMLQSRLDRYGQLIHAVPNSASDAVTASVIGRENRPFVNTIILDAGKKQNIKPGEAVVDARGFLGRIFLAGDHTSWVILSTDLSSHVPVVIEPGHIQAMMTGDNTTQPLLLTNAPNAKLKAGQQIATSGDGGLLPAGLSVGSVIWDGQNFRVSLLSDSAETTDVRILDLRNPPEQPPAPSQSDLPSVAAGLSPMPPAPPVTAPAIQPFAPPASQNAAASSSATAKPPVQQPKQPGPDNSQDER